MVSGAVNFGPFQLDTRAGLLRRGTTALNLTGQAYRMLELLVERAGELVSRDEIRDTLWPEDHYVDFEAAINVAARRIREVLGDSADSPTYLHTVRGRGYRFELPAPPEIEIRKPDPIPPKVSLFHGLVHGPFPWRTAGSMGIFALLFVVASNTGQSSFSPALRSQRQVAASGDGRWVAYAERQSIVLCETRSAKCCALLRRGGVLRRLIFSEDGRYLYFGSTEDSARGGNIMRIPTAGGPPSEVVPGTDRLQEVTHDGRDVLYLRSAGTEDVLYAAAVTGGPERRVLALPAGTAPANAFTGQTPR